MEYTKMEYTKKMKQTTDRCNKDTMLLNKVTYKSLYIVWLNLHKIIRKGKIPCIQKPDMSEIAWGSK